MASAKNYQMMNVQKISEVPQFQAANHWDMRSLRLQEGGAPAGPEKFSLSLSYFLPGGGAGPDASPTEKVYLVLDGQLALTFRGETATLTKMDSCLVPAKTERSLVNNGATVTHVLVITGMRSEPAAQSVVAAEH